MSNFRNLTLWVVIALLLVLLFNLFENSGSHGTASQVAFSEFAQQVNSNDVKSVTIQGKTISGEYKSGQHFTTYAPDDPNLVQRLLDHNVAVTAQPGEDNVPTLLGIFINWFPMLLLVGGVGVLPAPDAVGRRQGDGLRQEPRQAADRAPGPRHV